MAKKFEDDLSAAQLQIMNIVWERGEAGVAEIWEALARHRPVARNTVQTMLTRLHARGWLKHRREANAFYYTAARPRKRVLGRMVSKLVDAAFGGSASGLVLTLLQESKLAPDEAQRIREMIDLAESKPPKRR